MAHIITITLNPALDKSIRVRSLEPEKKLKAEDVKTEAGGGGINVSRALRKLGLDSKAFYLAGGYTGSQLGVLLKEQGVTTSPVNIKGETRENFVVYDAAADKQYRFGLEGPQVEEAEWLQLLKQLDAEDNVEYIVLSGSVPSTIPAAFFEQLGAIVLRKKAKLVADTSGSALVHAVNQKVFMLKPNLGELAALQGFSGKMRSADAVESATQLIKTKHCEMIVVSMGGEGALLVTAETHYYCKPPVVKVLSTVGAGDSMLAGILFALVSGYSRADALAYGVAAGTAATLHPGTELCSKVDTDRLFGLVDRPAH